MSAGASGRRAWLGPSGAGALLLALLVAPALWSVGAESDYAVHAELGAALARTGESPLPIPAPLFAWLVALGTRMLPWLRPLDLALGVGLASHLASYAVLLKLLRSPRAGADAPGAGTRRSASERIAEAALALALCLAAPIPIGSAADSNYYFGYVGLATYHNPTIALLRPLALLLFLAAEAAFDPARRGTRRATAVAALLSVLAALAKPSFSVALLPALAAAALWQRLESRAIRGTFLAAAIAAPTLLVLGFEYAQSFASGGGAGMRLAPFAAFRAGSHGSLPQKLLLSGAFPLAVVLCAPRLAARDAGLRLAWLCTGAGLAAALLLDETGPRAGHGNLLWSAQISLWVLFAASARWLFGAAAPSLGRRRRALVAGVLALHALSGLIWLGIHWLPLFDPGARPLREWF